MLKVHRVEAFDDNYIWLIGDSECAEVAVVDPGDDTPVQAYLEAQGLTPIAILLTHHHGDHTGGVEALVERYPVPVYGPGGRIRTVTHPVGEGGQINLAPLPYTLEVWATPGHTADHLSYLTRGALFCGDTLFTAGCGRIFDGSAEQFSASLARIRDLDDETLVYCAHEYTLDNLRFARIAEPDNDAILARQARAHEQRAKGEATVPERLGEEKATNPFLRCHTGRLQVAAETYHQRTLNNEAEVFAAVRRWKDDLD